MRLNHQRSTVFMDARDVLVVKLMDNELIDICWDISKSKLKTWFINHKNCDILVVTGFIARTCDDLPTTLKRNGSDFSATIFSALVKAQTVTIWKDVDGMYDKDPKKYSDAVLIPYQTFEEAEEASLHGAFVLQKDCIEPARQNNIPIFIRNSFNLLCPGTRIGPTMNSRVASDKTIFFMDESKTSDWSNSSDISIEDSIQTWLLIHSQVL